MRGRVLICVVAVLASATTSAAQSPSPTFPPAVKPKVLSQAERQRLSKDRDAAKSTDVFVALSTDGKATTTAERQTAFAGVALLLKVLLHGLYYPVDFGVAAHPSEDAPLHAALSEFEQRAGLQVDGVFTLGEFEELSYYAALSGYVQAGTRPLNAKMIGHAPGYMFAEGTWVIQGERIANPVNSNRINCWRDLKMCIVSEGHVNPPSRGGVSSGSSLYVDTSYWDITSWSDTRVVAEMKATCRRNVLTLDETAKQVFQVQTDTNGEGCGKLLEPLKAPRMTTLEDGFKVGTAHYDEMLTLVKKVSKFPFSEFERLSSGLK